jgi:CRP-like cAMP-binding protein
MVSRFLKRDKVEVLSQLPLFDTCSRRELGQVASISVDANRSAGTFLTREGRDGGLLFVILEGEAEVRRGNTVIGTLRAGDVVGELSLIDGEARSASVRAVTDVHVLEIAADDLRGLVRTSPKIARNLLRALSLRIRDTEERWPAEL